MPIRVLIVDDEPLVLRAWSRMLAREGMAVETADNAAEALEALRREPFDVALIDLVMPDPDGLQLIAQIRADPALQRVRLVAVTAALDIAARATGLPVLLKDGSPEDVASLIYRMVGA